MKKLFALVAILLSSRIGHAQNITYIHDERATCSVRFDTLNLHVDHILNQPVCVPFRQKTLGQSNQHLIVFVPPFEKSDPRRLEFLVANDDESQIFIGGRIQLRGNNGFVFYFGISYEYRDEE